MDWKGCIGIGNEKVGKSSKIRRKVRVLVLDMEEI